MLNHDTRLEYMKLYKPIDNVDILLSKLLDINLSTIYFVYILIFQLYTTLHHNLIKEKLNELN